MCKHDLHVHYSPCACTTLHGPQELLPCAQELPDSDVPVQPEELFCSQCCNDSMTMVRLATTEQLQDWLTVLHSKPSCKQPRVMQVCCSCPSLYHLCTSFGVVWCCLSVKGLSVMCSCKVLTSLVQVIWPTVIHSVKPSLQVALQDLLRGISHASLQA